MQLRFWFHGDDDEDGESDVDSDVDNDGAIIPKDGDGDDADDDDYESYEGERGRFGLENRRKFDRRRRYQHEEEEEIGEQNKVYRCIRYGCFGRYGYGAYDDDEEYANDPWENYYRKHGHGRGGHYGWGRDLFSSGDEEEIDEI
ncbi:hypothetical protein EGR_06426 [Echinococcus granulosus]|uniref:Uncharacterized protein n=1 Tax=Echinococcus granulosus TaxID=6210 RepID=W6UC47_ECHGR|nr:hypothetical protein EGR_06426 [Echinococcus granulosus]EUB58755.1 hypothetical protein EGR_06426 [Echinococcus granulosus]